ncbi:substrate-binding periplasmic protein [Motilimonas eburnea]|uniref:substrate-binding periplasmic protein n=1 Tax=Motilimonas eburnea TaxID=1737488 RepID=UPI001E39A504|nr:transporter substrate-binding domain-containing protein [Motilimonas eburnea]MCE2570190.1 transporter substrate-binding domain-containing protein [Motilimonas eburnea]
MKTKYLLILGFCICTTCFATGQTTLLVATDEWPPFRIADPNGFTGLDIQLLAALSEKTGIQFQVKRYPWARALSHMEIGQVDMMVGLAKTPARAQYIHYLQPSYYDCNPAFYTTKDIHKPIKNYQDLYYYRIGYVRDSAYFEPFDSDKELLKHSVPTEIQLLKMAQKGHIEVFIGTDCQVEYEISRRGLWLSLARAPYRPQHQVSLYIGFSKKSPKLTFAPQVENALVELLQSEEFEQIKRQYFAPSD